MHSQISQINAIQFSIHRIELILTRIMSHQNDDRRKNTI